MVRAGLAEMGMGRERCPPGPRPRREAVGEEAAGVASPPPTPPPPPPPRQPAFPAALMVLGCYLQLRPGPWSLKCLFPGRASAWETTGHPPPPSPSSWPQVCPTEGAALLLHPTESVCVGGGCPPTLPHRGTGAVPLGERIRPPPHPPKPAQRGWMQTPAAFGRWSWRGSGSGQRSGVQRGCWLRWDGAEHPRGLGQKVPKRTGQGKKKIKNNQTRSRVVKP